MVGDFRGGHRHYETGNLVAGNNKVYAAMLQAIAPYVNPALQPEMEEVHSTAKSATMSLNKEVPRRKPPVHRRPRKE